MDPETPATRTRQKRLLEKKAKDERRSQLDNWEHCTALLELFDDKIESLINGESESLINGERSSRRLFSDNAHDQAIRSFRDVSDRLTEIDERVKDIKNKCTQEVKHVKEDVARVEVDYGQRIGGLEDTKKSFHKKLQVFENVRDTVNDMEGKVDSLWREHMVQEQRLEAQRDRIAELEMEAEKYKALYNEEKQKREQLESEMTKKIERLEDENKQLCKVAKDTLRRIVHIPRAFR